MSTLKALTIFEPNEIRYALNSPYFLEKITVEDRVRDSFGNIILE